MSEIEIHTMLSPHLIKGRNAQQVVVVRPGFVDQAHAGAPAPRSAMKKPDASPTSGVTRQQWPSLAPR